jgi:hypothetical protein
MKALPAIAAAFLTAASLAAHAVGQRADVAIYDRATGRELPVYWYEGRAYVVGRPGNEYQVIVRNRLGEDLLAVVSVDGLNVMNGQAANPRQAGYIAAPYSRIDIRGWRKSLDEIAAFYFTQLGDSYAARRGRPENVGVIGVALFQRKRIEPPPEAAADPAPYRPSPFARDRSEAQRESANENRAQPKLQSGTTAQSAPAPSAPLGTGHGRREESRVQWQHFERATDSPVETIAIYYDSYRNLVAQGVLQPTYGMRDPNPWPTAFAPDP